jgi:hypothetical protein
MDEDERAGEEECMKRFVIVAENEKAYDEVVKVLQGLPQTESVDTYMKKHGLSMLWVTKVLGMGYVLAKLRDDGKIREYANDVVLSSL